MGLWSRLISLSIKLVVDGNQTSPMRINILCNEITKGWTPLDTRLGGSEESIVRWAEELARRSHSVTVYYNAPVDNDSWDDFTYRSKNKGSRGDGTYNGVWYTPREAYVNDGAYEPEGETICINIKSSEVSPKEPTLYLTNETDATSKDLSKYLGVIWPSSWALENIPVNNPNLFVLPHGYDDDKIKPKPKVKKQCLYSSSPDRGLETLEKIWPSVVEKHPDAHLYVSYGGKIDTPNTTCGDFSEEEMNELYNTSDIWLHPANGGELYAMSGKKAQVAGCIPVIIPTMALAETVRTGFFARDGREFHNMVLRALSMSESEKDALRRKVIQRADAVSWQQSTDVLLQVIDSVI